MQFQVKPSGKEFVATFVEANVATTAETPDGAMEDLMSLIEQVYDCLLEDKDCLGPGPQGQLDVLRRYYGAHR